MIWAYTMTPSSWCIKHPVWFWHASMRSPYHPWTRLDLDPEMDFDDSIYSVEFHASKILLLITGTWKSSWKFYTVPKIHNQSSGTGGSRYSCWRVPVNCTGSSYVDLLNSMDSVNSRFRLPSPHLLPRCGDLGVQSVSSFFYPPSSPLFIYSCLL